MTNLREDIEEILNGLATAYRKYPMKQIEETKEISQATDQILQAFEIEIANRKFNASPKYKKGWGKNECLKT